MPLVINTNVSSLNSQRQMMTSGNELDQAMERLSSGKRINNAADDAAGLSISNRFTSQIRGLDQAIRNANDGISLIQTAEGALDESTNILQRMRELAIQSSNGIYSDVDRATLDAEVQQLVAELDRIADTTSFNGQKILDGTLGSVELQIGAEANETVSFSIQEMNTQSLGLGSTSSDLSSDRIQDLTNLNTNVAGDNLNAVVTFGDGDILINGQGLSAFDGTTDNLQDIINDVNSNIDGVSASGFNVIEAGSVGDGVLAADEVLTISVFNVSDDSETEFTFSSSTDLADLVSNINSKTGGIVDASINDNGRLVLSNDTGSSIALSLEDGAGNTATLSSVLGISNTNVTDNGGSIGAATEFAASADYGVLFAGQLALSADDGSAISITKGANGTDADLSNLGFRETTLGEVQGLALSSAAQGTALAAGDLTINGTAIAATTSAEGLQGKIDRINDVTVTTGVVASAKAEQSYSYDATITPVEVAASNAYTAPGTASYQDLHFASGTVVSDGTVTTANGLSALDATNYLEFDVDDNAGVGTTTTVRLDSEPADLAALLADINSQLVVGGTDVEAFQDTYGKLAFRATATGGDILVDNFSETDAGTNVAPGTLNAYLGFDIEDLAGSGGSFAGGVAGFNINGTDISLGTVQAANGTISAVDVADAVNTASGTTGVTAYVDTSGLLHFSAEDSFVLAGHSNGSDFEEYLDSGANLNAGALGTSATLSTAPTTGSVIINGYEVTGISLTDADAAATTINAQQANTGVTASLDENGELELSANSSITLNIGDTAGIATGAVLGINFVDTDGGPDGVMDSQVVNSAIELRSVNDGSPISLELNGNGATATGLKDLNTDLSGTVTGSALSSINVATVAGAQDSIDAIDNALETINATRSELGAINNRLDFTVSNLANVSENASAARSRIVDADFAAETAALSRAQVLSQASQAMLAQANAAPQQVLSLLQG